LHDGSFVWADRQGSGASPIPFESTVPNQFRVRAAGGISLEGDVKLGSSAQLYAPGGEENLRLVRGEVSSAGVVVRGTGFTATKVGTGLYRVTFNTPFPSDPTVTANTAAYNFNGAGLNLVRSNSFEVVVFFNQTGPQQDSPFHFIAVGPR
jgi:hypothetical protein